MKNLNNKLNGYHTHIAAALIALTAVAERFGWIPMDVAMTLYGLLGAGGLSALRSGVARDTK